MSNTNRPAENAFPRFRALDIADRRRSGIEDAIGSVDCIADDIADVEHEAHLQHTPGKQALLDRAYELAAQLRDTLTKLGEDIDSKAAAQADKAVA